MRIRPEQSAAIAEAPDAAPDLGLGVRAEGTTEEEEEVEDPSS
jgi:hypothetical protein